ncbi:MAG: winged helix-turn-helix transcriptional regulator, partial [Actinomycetota bacterium]|nr:winged helix-turn-helix transcriptional regulator [Actinomycetota bacterium]
MIHPPDAPTRLGEGGDNAIAFAIGVTADEWTLLVLRVVMQRPSCRFADWQDALPIPGPVLTARLRRMVEAGILAGPGGGDDPADFDYTLTVRGAALWPFMTTIWAWERFWGDGHPQSVPAMRHAACEHEFEPVMACKTCGEVVPPRDVTGRFGPSGSWPRSAPNTTMRRRSSGSANLGPGFFPESRVLIGNRWSAAMLGAAYLGSRRFSEFQRRVGAPATVIADRLRSFCALGVLSVSGGQQDRCERSTYRLTDKGRA